MKKNAFLCDENIFAGTLSGKLSFIWCNDPSELADFSLSFYSVTVSLEKNIYHKAQKSQLNKKNLGRSRPVQKGRCIK